MAGLENAGGLVSHHRETTRRVLTVWALLATLACRDVAPPNAPPPRFPIIDIHTHLGGVETWPGSKPDFEELLRTMNEMRVEAVVDFKAPDNSLENGIFGERVTERIAIYPDSSRFELFANVPIDDGENRFVGIGRDDYPEWVAGALEDAVRRGAAGLKIKDQAGAGEYSYWTRDGGGALVPFDTSAFDPLWQTAERLGVPVMLHLGGAYKGEHQAPKGGMRDVRWEMLMLQRERVLRRHPRLRIIGAHWAGTAGDRTYLEEILERYPNMSAEGGAHQPKVEFAQLDSAELRFFERFQDQVMFGTDYMENTFRWLKSYRQRLDMFLPFTEGWPLADSIMTKYYNGNARRVLNRDNPNRTPVAHPGFTTTRLVGDTVALDGGASFAGAGAVLGYRWRQTEGTPVRMVGDTTARPRFTAEAEGDLAFELVVSADSLVSRPRSVRVNVVRPLAHFVEEAGQVVIEAEQFAAVIARGGQVWSVASTHAGFMGDGYVAAGPERNRSVEPGRFRAEAPELRYNVWITRPGTYVVYVRGMATDSGSNSVHVGLDNEEARLADRVGELPSGRWGWARNAFEWDAQFEMTDTTLAVLNIAEPGPHVVNIWMHEDGAMLDRIMLVRAPSPEVARPLFDPGATPGPAASARREPRR
jgi:predicted TIM-barrel fold metal-dependent hydrolase